MTDKPAFVIDLAGLKSRQKDVPQSRIAEADTVAERHGFVAREPGRRPGRRPSPRTGQVHAKVFPDVSQDIADEAARRGVTQGVLIEEAWKLYREANPAG